MLTTVGRGTEFSVIACPEVILNNAGFLAHSGIESVLESIRSPMATVESDRELFIWRAVSRMDSREFFLKMKVKYVNCNNNEQTGTRERRRTEQDCTKRR